MVKVKTSTTAIILMSFVNSRTSSPLLVRSMSILSPSKSSPYTLPAWAKQHFRNPPQNGRLTIANLPTPLHRIDPPFKSEDQKDGTQSSTDSILQRLRDKNITLFIKRDDMTAGVELGGNKIRKLEFLLADALQRDYDAVVTIGGEQSNHCRATVRSKNSFLSIASLLLSYPLLYHHIIY